MPDTTITTAKGKSHDLRQQILTQRDLIREVNEYWRVRYWEFDSQEQPGRNKFYGIKKSLKKLDVETATAAQVDAIVGDNSMTTYVCDSCEKRHETVIWVGTFPPDSTHTSAMVCAPCLRAALAALGEGSQS